jgi:hypothetical protein
MASESDRHAYPASFVANSSQPQRLYRLREDCFAIRGDLCPEAEARTIYVLPAEGITVAEGSPPAGRPTLAVYSFTPGEPPAVPTGRVFVRFEEGRAPNVEGTGYRIEEVPEYAPDSAWAVAADGRTESALTGLDRLVRLEGVVSVEPQMLRPVARRGL